MTFLTWYRVANRESKDLTTMTLKKVGLSEGGACWRSYYKNGWNPRNALRFVVDPHHRILNGDEKFHTNYSKASYSKLIQWS